MPDQRIDFTDDVRGVIIGGYPRIARLHYAGRPQGPEIIADDEAGLQQAAEARLQEIKVDCGAAFKLIYPEKAWTLRIAL